MLEVVPLLDARAQLGEATIWDPRAQVLWWGDIWGRAIHRYDPIGGTDEAFDVPEMVGSLGLRASGGLVVSLTNGFHFFDPDSGRLDFIVDPEADIAETRFNDGKTDRFGRFWSGSIFEARDGQPRFIGSLYRLDPDLSVHRTIEGIGACNGLAWSPDGRTMYFTDSYGPAVWAYEVDPATGELGSRRVFIETARVGSYVDGATVDAEGCYWGTVPVIGKVNRYDPDGKLMLSIQMPVAYPTCCEFGGPNLDVLYVTSATLNENAEALGRQTMPGGLFAINAGVKGLELDPFAG